MECSGTKAGNSPQDCILRELKREMAALVFVDLAAFHHKIDIQ